MKTHAPVGEQSQQKKNIVPQSSPFTVATESTIEDSRPEVMALQRFQTMAADNPRNTQLKSMQAMMGTSSQVRQLQSMQTMMGNNAVGTIAINPIQRMASSNVKTGQEKKITPVNANQNNLVQRLRWSEVFTGNREENVRIPDKQMPQGVEAVEGQGGLVDRNVWAGQTKKGRSGFLWHKESTLEIQYDIKAMQQYRIIDPTTVFYTAVREAAVEPIKKFGIDPNYGNQEKPDGSTQYNVRGFNYFGKDRKIPGIYGANYLAPEAWTIMSFRLPEGTSIERDPEIPNGLRTSYHIKPSDLAG